MKGRKRVLVLILGLILAWMIIFTGDRIVVRKGYVKSVEGEVVTIITSCGNVWEWSEDNTTYSTGDYVKLVMSNAGTEKVIEDDVIKLIIKIDK